MSAVMSQNCQEAIARGWPEKHNKCFDGAALACRCLCHQSSVAMAPSSAAGIAARRGVEGGAIGASGPRGTAGSGEVTCNAGLSTVPVPARPHSTTKRRAWNPTPRHT